MLMIFSTGDRSSGQPACGSRLYRNRAFAASTDQVFRPICMLQLHAAARPGVQICTLRTACCQRRFGQGFQQARIVLSPGFTICTRCGYKRFDFRMIQQQSVAWGGFSLLRRRSRNCITWVGLLSSANADTAAAQTRCTDHNMGYDRTLGVGVRSLQTYSVGSWGAPKPYWVSTN